MSIIAWVAIILLGLAFWAHRAKIAELEEQIADLYEKHERRFDL